MRTGRLRIDDRVCRYAVQINVRLGPDRPWLNRECRDRLWQIGNREIAFHCGVRVDRFRVYTHGFTLVCETGPECPPEAAVRAAWEARFAGTPREDEIDRPGMVERTGRRMRDFARLIGAIKQYFMQWYNRRFGCSGSLWEGRFRSLIVAVGEHVRRMLRRFRREMFPRAARGDPLWLEIVETAARMLERTLRMMFRLPTGYGL